MVDVVSKSRKSEAIVDLLYAWTLGYSLYVPLITCIGHLVCLRNLVPPSSRLRQLVIRSIELIGCEGFEEVGVEF